MTCSCFIIPNDVLEKISKVTARSNEIRNNANSNLKVSKSLRKLRTSTLAFTKTMDTSASFIGDLSFAPTVTVYDCKHLQTLPGTPIANPGSVRNFTASLT